MSKQNKESSLRLGIDVGGTNTDAVLMNGRDVVAAVKRSTTEDISGGIVDAVSTLMEDAKAKPEDVGRLMIGTTQFVNAFLQRKNLAKIAAVRVCAPKSDGVPPMVLWPEDVIGIIGNHGYMVQGGSFHNGVEYAPLDEDDLAAVGEDIAAKGIASVAVTSIFSAIRPDIEDRAAEIIAKQAPGVHITKSAEVGGVGLIDRENATIINAALAPFAKKVVASMNDAFASIGLRLPPLFSQNDGTLITGEQARRYPIFTCAAGPTNSIRGAGFLTGIQEAIVVDIGGTTTDIGFLTKGFPRETASANNIGGVRTNFRMPDVLSIALGGGTKIVPYRDEIKVGPESVGYRLESEARIFGGEELTATDIAVAAYHIDLGDRAKVSDLDKSVIKRTTLKIRKIIETAIDQMRSSAKKIDVILVGGGAILVKDHLEGAARLMRPEHAGVANAVGAAIAQVSGRMDNLYDFADGGREAALERATQDAINKAVAGGAARDSIEIFEVEELPMTHVQSSLVRVRVNAVGDLD